MAEERNFHITPRIVGLYARNLLERASGINAFKSIARTKDVDYDHALGYPVGAFVASCQFLLPATSSYMFVEFEIDSQIPRLMQETLLVESTLALAADMATNFLIWKISDGDIASMIGLRLLGNVATHFVMDRIYSPIYARRWREKLGKQGELEITLGEVKNKIGRRTQAFEESYTEAEIEFSKISGRIKPKRVKPQKKKSEIKAADNSAGVESRLADPPPGADILNQKTGQKGFMQKDSKGNPLVDKDGRVMIVFWGNKLYPGYTTRLPIRLLGEGNYPFLTD